MKSEKKITGTGFYALGFGLFLGLAILKFGNPVILDQKITPPVSPVTAIVLPRTSAGSTPAPIPSWCKAP